MSARTATALPEALPEILRNRGMTIGSLARALDVDKSFLTKAVHERDGKVASPDLIVRICRQLGLADDYFPEVRLSRTVAGLKSDSQLLDETYERLLSRATER